MRFLFGFIALMFLTFPVQAGIGLGANYSFNNDFEEHTGSRQLELSARTAGKKYSFYLTHVEAQYNGADFLAPEFTAVSAHRTWSFGQGRLGLYVSTGLAVIDRDRVGRQLGSRLQASQRLGLRIGRHLDIGAAHFSCAGLCEPNVGYNMLTATWWFD